MNKTLDYFIASLKGDNKDKIREEPKCCHDVASGSSTLIKSSKRCLVYPGSIDYVCKVCHKQFRYTKHGDIYTLVKSD